MEKDPAADECKEIFEQHVDELPFDEAVEAIRGLRNYLKEAQRELFEVKGWERHVLDTSHTDDLP